MNKKRLRSLTYLASFFLTVTVSLPAYINSSFLKEFIDEKNIGLIFGLASLFTIALTIYLPTLLNRKGNLGLILLFTLASLISIWGVAGLSSPFWILFFFIIYYSLAFLLRYLFDIYLESLTENENTGNIRGLALTAYNIAWLASPFVAGVLAGSKSFRLVYFLSSLFFIPVIFILFFLKEKKGIDYSRENLLKIVKKLWTSEEPKGKDLRNILAIDFLLNFFYAVMVIYTPLYLLEKLNLSLPELGFIFTVMLLPFVLFEYPLGKLADKVTGEKELLITGLILISVFTALISFTFTTNLILWAFLLFATRVGAATVEVMKETYLFKKIDGKDAPVLALSRLTSPISYLIGPLLVSLFFYFFEFHWLFLFLGLFMLSGLWFASKLKDTNE